MTPESRQAPSIGSVAALTLMSLAILIWISSSGCQRPEKGEQSTAEAAFDKSLPTSRFDGLENAEQKFPEGTKISLWISNGVDAPLFCSGGEMPLGAIQVFDNIPFLNECLPNGSNDETILIETLGKHLQTKNCQKESRSEFQMTSHPLLGKRYATEWLENADGSNEHDTSTKGFAGWWQHANRRFLVVLVVQLPKEAAFDHVLHREFRELAERSFQHAREHELGDAAPIRFVTRGPFVVAKEGELPIQCFESGYANGGNMTKPIMVVDPAPDDVVADIGCGSGGAAMRMGRYFGESITVIGRDVSKSSLVRSSSAPNVTLGLSSYDDVMIDPESIDKPI